MTDIVYSTGRASLIYRPRISPLPELRRETPRQGDALLAGIRYIRARHPRIVEAARDEALQGIRYRAARRREVATD